MRQWTLTELNWVRRCGAWLLTIVAFAIAHHSTALAVDKPQGIDDQATHEQVSTIEIAQSDEDQHTVNAFCLSPSGAIVAACGAGPGEIRILNTDGKLLNSWKVDVRPEAVNTSEDGSVLVGGDGQLFQFDSSGKLIRQAESPHSKNLKSNKDELRKEAIASLSRRRPSAASRLATYEAILKQLEEKKEKGELNDQEERTLSILPNIIKSQKEQAAEEEEEQNKEPTEDEIEQVMDSMLKSKLRIASISTDEEHLYIATRDLAGYGYAVWKLNPDFSGGEEIVNGLRGCCGQMDVQVCENGLFVAENSRHRVVRFDTKGEELTQWGKQDRKGIEGFTSCCNPMNVCFNGKGEVFTAESSTGRIKRYNAEGKLLSYIGDVKLVPGCKNVSIAVADDNTVYMLDITRNHIVVMKEKSEDSEKTDSVEKAALRQPEPKQVSENTFARFLRSVF